MVKIQYLYFFIIGVLFTFSLNAQELKKHEYIEVSLIDVVLETVAQSNNVKAAREKLKQAELKLDDAKREYYPEVDAKYTLGRTKAIPGNDDESSKFYNDKNYKFTVTQNLYAGGATSSNIKNLKEKLQSAKSTYKQAIAKEIQNAIKAYFDVLFNYKSLIVNIENMDKLNEILEIVTTKYELGAASQGDLSSIRANVSNAESKLIKIESKFHEALEYYEYIVGKAFSKTFPYEDSFDTTVDDFDKIVEKAIENNLTIQKLKFEIKAEKFNLTSARSKFRPQIDLQLSSETILDQEDFEDVEKNHAVQVVMSYNLYNKGKDKNKILSIHSAIREMNYKLKEEIRKLKWSLSKLHRSIISIHNASKSKKEEVSASLEMVASYWDGFKLGEQDLQELLQGQRQLNSAQLELIDNKKSVITDYFKLLSASGDILEYFHLDINADNFIDFSRSDYKNLLKTQEEPLISGNDEEPLNLQEEKKEEVAKTKEEVIEEKEDIVQSDSLKDILDFEQKFKQSDESNFTIRVYPFEKVYQALDYAKEKEIANSVYLFDAWDDKIAKTNIAYGIFETKELADKKLDGLQKELVNIEVVSIKDIKSLEEVFKNEKVIEQIVVAPTPKKKKKFTTYSPFKEKFLDAPKEYFTINITSFLTMKEAGELVKKEDIYKQSFIFSYGDDTKLFKVMYGVFETYEEASKALEQMPNIKQLYEPVIENIQNKQELYLRYNSRSIDKKLEIKDVVETLEPTIDNNTQSELGDDFKKRFLDAPKEYYTLNLATLPFEENTITFKEKNRSYIEIFTFPFGYDKVYYKAMGGIYKSYDEAQEALSNLPEQLLKNNPRIEQISIKQQLYKKYNTTNEEN